jgi:hypothetical protein
LAYHFFIERQAVSIPPVKFLRLLDILLAPSWGKKVRQPFVVGELLPAFQARARPTVPFLVPQHKEPPLLAMDTVASVEAHNIGLSKFDVA